MFKKISLNLALLVALAFNLYGVAYAVPSSQTKDNIFADHRVNQALLKLKNSDRIYKLNLRLNNLRDFININQQNRSIEYIEPNYLYQAVIEPNDIYYNQQVYLSSIKANLAWNYTTGNNSVIIAVIDSGVDIEHADLKNNSWYNLKEIPDNNLDDDHNGYIDDYRGWDFVDNNSDPRPKFDGAYTFLGINHGTIVAGVAAAEGNNNRGISGVVWGAKIMSLRVLDGSGTGNTFNVAKAIDYAVKNKADIINLSFVGQGHSITLEQAIARAHQAGILIVAAAGNEVSKGVDTTLEARYPVCHDGGYGNNWVIGVASVDKNNRLASFSNYGKCVDVIAPGVGIFSTLFKDNSNAKFNREYGGYWSGTSVSAPQVSGLAALVKSLKPKLSLKEVQNLILNNTDSVNNKNMLFAGKLGRGKINAAKTLSATLTTISQIEHKVDKIIMGPSQLGGPHVRVYSEHRFVSQFFAFDQTKRFGVNVASYDFDKDGQQEIIVAANDGEQAWVKIFDIYGNLMIKFLAFGKNMKEGLNVAAGDINNDGATEIVVVAKSNYQPLVKIFNSSGDFINEFYAFNKFFKGGLSLAIGDVNNDDFEEIVIGAGKGTSSLVKVFNYNGHEVSQFIAYQPSYLNGISLAVGDVDGNGQQEIIIGTLSGGEPEVRIFDWQGKLQTKFYAYNRKFLGGVNLATGDINGDGLGEIITGAGPGGGPHVRVFNGSGQLLEQFFAYDQKFRGGVLVASGK